jgi:energy-coupling factor transporter ATP-binding protein EcfA2
MSDRVALTHVNIQGFRTLSEPLSIDFGEGPGVTILVGPNGSGKSTVLDGIEWALTREASRLPRLRGIRSRSAPNVFKTLGSNAEPQVELRFVDIGSGARHTIRAEDEIERVGAYLRRSEMPWRDFKAAEAALRWTHFSSQRSTARLGYENDEAILKAFAGPTGLERHKGLDRRLWGPDTRAALRELTAEVDERVRKHDVALAYVDRLLAAQAAPGAGAIGAGHRVALLLGTIVTELGPHFADLSSDLEELEEALVEERSTLESQLTRLRALNSERRDASIRARRLAADSDAARQSRDTAIAVNARRLEAMALAESEVEDARSAVESARVAIDGLKENVAKRERLGLSEAEANRLAGALSEASLRAQVASERLDLLNRLDAQSVRVRAGLALIELQRSQAITADFGDPEAIRDAADIAIGELSERLGNLNAKRRDAETTIATERDRLQTIAALSTALSEHLSEHDTACPVCASDYALGELVARARAASIRVGPASERIALEINELTQELGRVTGQLQFARARREEADGVATARRRYRAEAERQAALFGEPWSGNLQEEIESEVADLKLQLGLAEDNDAIGLKLSFEERQQYFNQTMTETEAQLREVVALRDQLKDELAGAPEDSFFRNRIAVLQVQSTLANNRLIEAQDELRFATEMADAAQAQLQRASESLEPVEESYAEEAHRLALLDKQRFVLIDGGSEEAFLRSSSERIVRLGLCLDQLRAIRSEEEMRRHANASDPDLLLLRAGYLSADSQASDAELRIRIAEALAQAQVELVNIETLGRRLNSRAKLRRQIDVRLQGSALEPWNNMFRAVYASLAGALGETLEWTARTDMRFSELNAHPTPHVFGRPIHGWMAGHFFSEGQLAALQIAAMITASVLLPWSRWNALLLDDPLQHADVIKVGAFADLMRGLCQDLGHQIILTTHDGVQAEFIAAKFRASNLLANIVRFERPTVMRSNNLVD